MSGKKEELYMVTDNISLKCNNEPYLSRSVKVKTLKAEIPEEDYNKNDVIYYLNLGNGGNYKISKELYELIIQKQGEQ